MCVCVVGWSVCFDAGVIMNVLDARTGVAIDGWVRLGADTMSC